MICDNDFAPPRPARCSVVIGLDRIESNQVTRCVMFAATVGWSHRVSLKASFFPEEEGDGESFGGGGGVEGAALPASAEAAAAVVAVDGEAVVLSASSSAAAASVSSVSSGEGIARRLGSFRRRGERGGEVCGRRR